MEAGYLPPPTARPGPKSNADFRALLDTPRPPRGDDDRKPSSAAAGSEKKKQRKPFKPKQEEAKDEEDDGPKYRDRAAERRKMEDTDVGGVGEYSAVPAQPNLNNISIEESKFLGGDLEHTHLVKGLDFALLQKNREEEKAKEEELAEEEEARKKAAKRREEMNFKTLLARAVYNAVFHPPKVNVVEMFQPRRTAFVFDLDDSESGLDIPTTLRRSKADCPKVVETMLGGVDAGVLERLAKVMGYMRVTAAGKPGKRLKKREKLQMLGGGGGLAVRPLNGTKQAEKEPSSTPKAGLQSPTAAQQRAAAADDSDDDEIFGGAGKDFEDPVAAAAKALVQQNGAAAANGSHTGAALFGSEARLADLPPGSTAGTDAPPAPPPPPPPPPSAPPGPPGAPPPPPPPPSHAELDPYAAPGPAMPPAGYSYDYSQAYGDAQQWDGQGYPEPESYAAYAAANAAAYDPSTAPLTAAGEDGELTAEEKAAGLASFFKRDDARLATMREEDEQEKDPNFVSDAYAECYPSYHALGTEIVESDDEDLGHMDAKAGQQVGYKPRSEYATEEEWQAAKSRQETLPKAAFQFGVKMADGRKSQGKLGKGKTDQKINNELQKIQGLLDKKGGNYGKAFQDGGKTPKSGSRAERRAAEREAAAVPAKRLRI